MKLSIIAASLLPFAARAGWITFQNENKQNEGLPCIGSLYGNDNWLVSQFDCNAPDWNGTMCEMKCFPISSTTCIGFPPEEEKEKYGVAAGIWYAPHGNDKACIYLGSEYGNEMHGADYSDRIGPNTTACGYIDWPEDRNFGPVKRKDHGDQKTKGCWDTDMKPDSRYNQTSVHFFDGARPLDKEYCKSGFAHSCGENHDRFCEADNDRENQLKCKHTKKPKNPEIPKNMKDSDSN